MSKVDLNHLDSACRTPLYTTDATRVSIPAIMFLKQDPGGKRHCEAWTLAVSSTTGLTTARSKIRLRRYLNACPTTQYKVHADSQIRIVVGLNVQVTFEA